MDESKMNRKDIIQLAGKAWLTEYGVKNLSLGNEVEIEIGDLVKFASLVAEIEREACALICEEYDDYSSSSSNYHADLIRARNEQ